MLPLEDHLYLNYLNEWLHLYNLNHVTAIGCFMSEVSVAELFFFLPAERLATLPLPHYTHRDPCVCVRVCLCVRALRPAAGLEPSQKNILYDDEVGGRRYLG